MYVSTIQALDKSKVESSLSRMNQSYCVMPVVSSQFSIITIYIRTKAHNVSR